MGRGTKVLSQLEGHKYSGENDLKILQTTLRLTYSENPTFWESGSKEREQLLKVIGGKTALSAALLKDNPDSYNLVKFLQGLLILAISVVNGLGRSPLFLLGENEESFKIQIGGGLPLNLNIGKFDEKTSHLVREFKKTYFGQAPDDAITNKELKVIKEAFKETVDRLENEKKIIEKLARNPLEIFGSEDKPTEFISYLFLLLSSMPTEQLNSLLITIGSYLPPELEERTDENILVNVRNYFTTSNASLHELLKKVRMLLKLHFSPQQSIVNVIIKEKTKDTFKQILQNTEVKKNISQTLKDTAENQFDSRIKILLGYIKLL